MPDSDSALSFHNPIRAVRLILTHPRYFWLLASLVIIGDVILTQLIIRLIPYTEIDWKTYMVQIEVYMKGQHDYSMITGPTGPLVYPAGHVHIHSFLHGITDSGLNLSIAQHIYAVLYIASLVLSCAIYRTAGNVPNWTILLLPVSKRLHSIYVLRLFNDCWAVVVVQSAIFLYQHGLDDTATLLFSAALSIKMSILLYLPGLLVILFKRRGLASTLRLMMTIGATHVLLAFTFLRENHWAYLQSSFDLSRVFLYKWTVNWRFVDEETFLSSQWAKGLLVGHVSVLILFGLFRWCQLDGGVWRVIRRGIRQPLLPAGLAPLTADYVATVLFTSNLIGILFARSLHYQFYSWYAQQIPFLAWRTRYPVVMKLALIIGIEYAWNVFPSTTMSSSILVAANTLLMLGIWFGHSNGIVGNEKIKTMQSSNTGSTIVT